MTDYLDRSLAKLKEFEGCVPWMYRDTVGKVTVGVGLMVPDVEAAQALPFAAGGRGATKEEIEAEFLRVLALPEGRAAGFYRTAGSLELPDAVIDAKVAGVLEGFEATLRDRLRGYDAMPDAVKLALLDMAYNLGVGGLLRDYPRLMRAVEAGAWVEAAGECERHGPSVARNAWTKAMFLEAAAGGELRAVKARAEGWFARGWRWLREGWRGAR